MRLALGWLLWFQWTAALRVIVSPRAVRGSSAALLTLAVGQPLLEDPQNLPKMPSAFFGFEEGGWLEVSLSAKPFADYGAYGRSEPYTLPTWSIQPAALSGHQLVRKMLAYFGPTVSSWGRRWVSDDADGQAIEMCPNSSELMRNGVVHEVGYSSESQTGGGRGQMLLVASSDDIPKCAVVAEDRRLLADRSTEGDDAANISSAFLFLMNERQWALAHRALLSRLRVDPLHRFAWNTFLPSAVRVPLDSNVTFSYRVLEAGRYLLFVMAPDGEPYWLQGEINLTNPHGGHLSTTQYHEGEVVAVMAVAYGAVAMILFVLRFSTWKSGWNARHSLIGTVFALKSTYLVLDACNCRVYQERGTLPTMRIVVPKLVAKLEDIAALMMFFLLSLGWRVFRRRLTRLESRLAAALAVLSFYLAVFEIVMGGFQLSRYILHAFAFLCIIVAVNFNVALLSCVLLSCRLVQNVQVDLRLLHYEALRAAFFQGESQPSSRISHGAVPCAK
eukprot:Polyplicarium_translucidae@DN2351_c0_g1_i4.p1